MPAFSVFPKRPSKKIITQLHEHTEMLGTYHASDHTLNNGYHHFIVLFPHGYPSREKVGNRSQHEPM